MIRPGRAHGHQVGCDRCKRPIAARYSILEQHVCNACYSRLRRHPGSCPGCHQVKVLAFYDSIRRIVCATCAGVPPRFACITCGSEEQLTGSQCGTCRLTERLRDVLADKTGGIHPGLATLYDHLLTARDPRAAVRWLRKEPVRATLRAMAAGELPIRHSTLDALPPSPRVRYLRRMLISAGTLPAIDVLLNDLENHAAAFIAGLPTEHGAITAQYFHWELLRKNRQRSANRAMTPSSYSTRSTELRKIAHFLAWLDANGLSLPSLDQTSVDRFFAHHHSQVAVGTFLNWAIRQGLTSPVKIPGRKLARPRPSVPDDVIWNKVDQLVDDESVPLGSRVIGILVLVFAQRISDCVRLCRSDVTDGEKMRITLGRTPLTLPSPIAVLLRRHLEELSTRRPYVAGGPDWLFPGAAPHDHVSEASVALHLAPHKIHARKIQQARIDHLVQTVPASIVADTLGINIHTAVKHAARTNSRWGDYPELRASPQESGTRANVTSRDPGEIQ